ncbi:MAG TPA: NAD-dependent epimerase/dehydratase family protein [Jiangellaceae bacterium]
MRLLVLGGTRFVGPPIVAAAIARGWEVTTFNRGVSGHDVPGTDAVHGDRTAAADVASLTEHGPWDAAVDLAGYVPVETLALAKQLEPHVSRYVFMSTVSVYQGWPVEPLAEASAVLACPPDAGPDFGTDVEDGPTKYGYQKSGSESAVRLVFGEDRSAVLRPGVVLGPGEYVGRLPWWLRRIAKGGQVLAPGTPGRAIQPVDVRDLAQFACHLVEQRQAGTFNVTAPMNRDTFAALLEACVAATSSPADLVWVPDDVLLSFGVRQWSELPLWRVHRGVWEVASTAAQAAGLTCRPLAETVRDTWAWLNETDHRFEDDRAQEIGIDPGREAEIIAAVR